MITSEARETEKYLMPPVLSHFDPKIKRGGKEEDVRKCFTTTELMTESSREIPSLHHVGFQLIPTFSHLPYSLGAYLP
jgi:hypothetical protein